MLTHKVLRFSIFICASMSFFFLGAYAPDAAAWVDNPCDPEFVSVNAKGSFVVSPTGDTSGTKDTRNIRCVSHAITNFKAYSLAQLISGDFYVRHVDLECPAGDDCSFSGSRLEPTVINFPDNSINCNKLLSEDRLATGLTFVRDWEVGNLDLSFGTPCGGGEPLFAGLAFTTPSDLPGVDCVNDSIDITVDNLRVNSLSNGLNSAVYAGPNGLGGCNDRLFGRFNSNRIEIDGAAIGLLTTMSGGATDNHVFLDVKNTQVAYWKFNGNQNTTINSCNIDVKRESDLAAFGVLVSRNEQGPKFNNTSVNNCTINFDSTSGAGGAGIFVTDEAPPSNWTTAITRNRFNFRAPNAHAVFVQDTSNGTITSNRFSGDALTGISLTSESWPVNNWVMAGNSGWAGLDAAPDISFSAGTSNNIVGCDPAVSVIDFGENFDLHRSSLGPCSSFEPVPATTDSRMQTATKDLMRRYQDMLGQFKLSFK